MCEAQMEISKNMTVIECNYCGFKQTIPKTDNDKLINMYNTANYFRQQCEFDKATKIYEEMMTYIDNDSELYWAIVLCHYGVKYVNNPVTKKKIVTCHQAQYKSIFDDPNYMKAINYSDMNQRYIYEREAKCIDNIQKRILEISNREEPVDVFICYKESDKTGSRTSDSNLAQEIYYALQNEGLKVFYSRITLGGKIDTEYEPYIFAALNSAKVMIVVGTLPEYFNDVLVKNEWNRFLKLMHNNKKKIIINAYKDISPYELPDALSLFPSLDMTKISFLHDLLHIINQIAYSKNDNSVATPQSETDTNNLNIENMFEQNSTFIENDTTNELTRGQSATNSKKAIIIAIISAVSALFLVIGVMASVKIFSSLDKPDKYNNNVEIYNNDDYKDADSYLQKSIFNWMLVNKGDVVKFGNYKWYVIDKSDNSCKILCKDIIIEKPYNSEWKEITWENCTLRQWLNDTFYNEFNNEEKAMIKTIHNINSDNNQYSTSGGNETDDNIYLLSIDEARKLDQSILKRSTWWWLRSPGIYELSAADVTSDGYIGEMGRNVDYIGGVRPVITIKID